jgi:hypothetical protein
MRVFVRLMIIYVMAVILALVGTPVGDPYSFLVGQVALSVFGLVAFVLGRQTRASTVLPS